MGRSFCMRCCRCEANRVNSNVPAAIENGSFWSRFFTRRYSSPSPPD
ncbi:hypothetical protein EGT07_04790 [Herbaspirillum sp. HC18]|nr:hypothetical protein EGT07_04790 [Herbaspirillum sp. HC18]